MPIIKYFNQIEEQRSKLLVKNECKANPFCIQFIQDQQLLIELISEDISLLKIRNDFSSKFYYELISYLSTWSHSLFFERVKAILDLGLEHRLNLKIKKLIINANKDLLLHMNNIPRKFICATLKKSPFLLANIRTTAKEQEFILKNIPNSIRYIQNPTLKILKFVLKRNPSSINCIHHCDILRLDQKTLKYVVKRYSPAFMFIAKQTDSLIEYALKFDPFVIKHINNPSEEIQLKCISKNPYTIEWIDNPSPRAIQLAFSINPESLYHMSKFVDLKTISKIIEKNPKAISQFRKIPKKYILNLIKNKKYKYEFCSHHFNSVDFTKEEVDFLTKEGEKSINEIIGNKMKIIKSNKK